MTDSNAVTLHTDKNCTMEDVDKDSFQVFRRHSHLPSAIPYLNVTHMPKFVGRSPLNHTIQGIWSLGMLNSSADNCNVKVLLPNDSRAIEDCFEKRTLSISETEALLLGMMRTRTVWG